MNLPLWFYTVLRAATLLRNVFTPRKESIPHDSRITISIAFIGLAVFVWSHFNSGVSLLAGAALLVAGAMVFLFAMKSVLKYFHR
jgi:hypothetical protein